MSRTYISQQGKGLGWYEYVVVGVAIIVEESLLLVMHACHKKGTCGEMYGEPCKYLARFDKFCHLRYSSSLILPDQLMIVCIYEYY